MTSSTTSPTPPSGPTYPEVTAATGLVVEDRSSGFCGDIIKWSVAAVTLRDRKQQLRHFAWKPGGFLLEGKPVTLVRPAAERPSGPTFTASGSVAAKATTAKVAAASRIWVEGRHDAELLEHVWGDDLRDLGIVVEPMHGIDDLAGLVAEFQPGPTRRLGVLVDHLVDGLEGSAAGGHGAAPGRARHRASLRRRVGRHPSRPAGTRAMARRAPRVCRGRKASATPSAWSWPGSGPASATRSAPTPTSVPSSSARWSV